MGSFKEEFLARYENDLKKRNELFSTCEDLKTRVAKVEQKESIQGTSQDGIDKIDVSAMKLQLDENTRELDRLKAQIYNTAKQDVTMGQEPTNKRALSVTTEEGAMCQSKENEDADADDKPEDKDKEEPEKKDEQEDKDEKDKKSDTESADMDADDKSADKDKEEPEKKEEPETKDDVPKSPIVTESAVKIGGIKESVNVNNNVSSKQKFYEGFYKALRK